ncbi:hypothetical protein TUBRATIS_25640 [Tubulinosema ratisbonensis]|uniref:Uncharacterized protein n=1 Tax=Tubulinosema ratisbonensis TaxID=291195 RepID=A0A437AIL4_9MICR|nr:hypothetical protein TUBRATIS_25640 [Tubulinosema ratisbonensis]
MFLYLTFCYSFYLKHFSKRYLVVEGNKLSLTSQKGLASSFCFDQDSFFTNFMIKTHDDYYFTKEENELILSKRKDSSFQKFKLVLDSTGRLMITQNDFVAVYNEHKERFLFKKLANTDSNGFQIIGDPILSNSPVENKFVRILDVFINEKKEEKSEQKSKTHNYRLLEESLKKKPSIFKKKLV